jgi:hypothetical protein
MKQARHNKRFSTVVMAVASLVATGITGAEEGDYLAALEDLRDNWDTLETYCSGCHNFEDYAGGIDFTSFSADDVADQAETFEMALRSRTNGRAGISLRVSRRCSTPTPPWHPIPAASFCTASTAPSM